MAASLSNIKMHANTGHLFSWLHTCAAFGVHRRNILALLLCLSNYYLVRLRHSRYEVFLKRLELSDDPAAREYLRFTNAQILNSGHGGLHSMITGLRQSLGQYEMWAAKEEAVAADPIAHQRFLQARAGMQKVALFCFST